MQHQDDDEQELPQGKDEEQEPHGSSFISIGIHFMFSPSHAIAMGIGMERILRAKTLLLGEEEVSRHCLDMTMTDYY